MKSKGINFFGPEPISPAILAGEEWKIENSNTEAETLTPTEVVTYVSNNSLSLRFKDYEEIHKQTSEDD